MSALHDIGRAKLNLTLKVLGRRADGLHALESLVAFAGLGDTLSLDPGPSLGLDIEGPFARALGGDNLILEAARRAEAELPGLTLGRFRLHKFLPVAAGLGGGSADAAAALRLIARANAGRLKDPTLAELAREIGSDVSVCLASRPALIAGRGETVTPVRNFPSCGVLLANPGVPLATPAVYAALQADACAPDSLAEPQSAGFQDDFDSLIVYLAPRGNDLEAPAARLVPEIREVLAALLALDGVRLARMSGSGPTCFALFPAEEEARRAGAILSAQRPDWWIAADALGG
ncbi:MAG: 4-(cytidine 5'-diphospho)-2-C-methyl-D-erythritol kinase [Methyloceanibacter sp.]